MQRISILLFALFIALTTIAHGQVQPSRMVVDGLSSEVTVRRDGRGIPYIEAKNDADLYFAQGYVMAGDRLWQMDLMRRVARGQTAELFGERTLEEDKRWRRFGFASIVEQSMANLSPELRKALDNYTRGVNAYIAGLDDSAMPPEFKILQYKPTPWLPTDTIIIGKILSDALSSTWRNDLIRASIQNLPAVKIADLTNQVTQYDVVLFGKDAKKTAAAAAVGSVPPASALAMAARDEELRANSLKMVGLYAEGLAASNNWVISGKKTADGKPILANDPHLAATAPGIWYLIDLKSPTMHVAGVTLPGTPGVVLGHNDSIAWGATNVGPDVQDLYTETFNDAGEYKTPTGWAKPIIRKEIIAVRGNLMKPDTTDLTYEVVETRNGVVITDEVGQKFALKWTARDPKNAEFEAFFQLNRASDWNSFKSALRTYGGATQNFVFADVKGNIGWYAAGRIPIRKVGDGALPYDGSKTDGDWTSMIPFDELPNLYNPPEGLIVTANQRIVSNQYKYTQMSRDAAAPWRARRIQTLLENKQKITMDDVRDVQHDVSNMPLSNLSIMITSRKAASAETLAILNAWDGKMTADSRGSVLTNEIRGCIANKMAEDNKPTPAYIIRERIIDWAVRDRSARWLPKGFANYDELMKACDTVARASLTASKAYGSDPNGWTWGKTWQSRFAHPLAAVPFIGGQFATPVVPISGSGQTPNVGSSVSMRLIATPGNWDATRHVIPMGQSGNPASPHFKDQFDLWNTGTPAILPFSPAAITKATTTTTIMTPKP